jgi:dihydroorotase
MEYFAIINSPLISLKSRNISSAVSIDHLYFTDEDLLGFDSNLKILPPLRSKKDRKVLREAVLNKTIDMVTSDHRPLTSEEKEVEFNRSYYGSTGLETAFPVLQEVFGRDSAVELLTRGRNRFGIQEPVIKEGEPTSISLFDPEVTFDHTIANQFGKSKNSPYLGRKFKGRPYGIISNNRMVIRPDQNVKPIL